MSVATIGSALAEKRRELGLEKGQAADKIGMSRTTYSSYEQDAQRPSVDVFPALAEFLSVSMEELLALYGATCVAAIRPSLERLLSDRGGESKEQPNKDDSAPRPDDFEGEARQTVTAAPFSGSAIGPNEALQDENEVTFESNVSVQRSDVATLDVESLDVESLDVAEVKKVPELPDLHVQLGSVELDTFSPPVSEGRGEPTAGLAASDPHSEPPAWLDPMARSLESQEIGSTVFEPSPYFIRTSITDDEKAPESKKKKKKKKKSKGK